MIHPAAIVDSKAEIGEGVEIGPYTVVRRDVVIGQGTRIGPHVVIGEGTQLGKNCEIYQFASIGEPPQALAYKGEKTYLLMGDHNIVRECVTLNRGTVQGGGKTVIGHNNLFMAYSHVGHDCTLGNQVILANSAALAGHIILEDYAIVGGLSAVHQFCRVGTHAFVGGVSGVLMDIPPYTLAQGAPSRLHGLNTVGIKRHGFSAETVRALKKAYRIIFRSALTLEKAVKRIEEDEIAKISQVQHLLHFIQNSKRGITR
jgi:UDP-N-acetylglucosamine acyltransferase